MLSGRGWHGDSLRLPQTASSAIPCWDVVVRMEQDFAVEAVVLLEEWPLRDWQGSIISQHGPGTGWELRCGGAGVNCVFTTTSGGHNEHMMPLMPGSKQILSRL